MPVDLAFGDVLIYCIGLIFDRRRLKLCAILEDYSNGKFPIP
jgi:hypothetical protein